MLRLRTRCVCRREIAFSNSIARRELNKLYKAFCQKGQSGVGEDLHEDNKSVLKIPLLLLLL